MMVAVWGQIGKRLGMRFKTFTLGCKVNQYETALIRQTFLANGWTEESDFALLDLALINTCSVTAESDAKSRKLASSLAKKAPNARIAMLGCYAATDPAGAAALANVDYVVGDKRLLPEFFHRLGLDVLPDGIDSLGTRHRAYVKIQDGCRVGCAYCIIPTARPYLASRSVESILREVERLAEAGYREIVLTGIHLGHYGLDQDAAACGIETNDLYCRHTAWNTPSPVCLRETGVFLTAQRKSSRGIDLAGFFAARDATAPKERHNLTRLLQRLLAEKFPVRYRLGSLEAVETPDELVDLIAESHGAVCPHFHLSMQSASDAVLKRMKRRWLSAPFFDRCESIQRSIPGASLTTDVIVGFPGETENDFLDSCRAVEHLAFAKTHIFRFSPRRGTVAELLDGQIPEPVKKERAARLEQIAEAARLSYARTRIGKSAELLIEEFRSFGGNFYALGTSETYLPARTNQPDALAAAPGTLLPIKVQSVDPDGTLVG